MQGKLAGGENEGSHVTSLSFKDALCAMCMFIIDPYLIDLQGGADREMLRSLGLQVRAHCRRETKGEA